VVTGVEIGGVNINLVELSGFVGAFVIPWVMSILQQDHFSRGTNTAIRFVVAAGAAVIMAGAKRELDVNDVVASFVAVVVTAQAVYHQLLGKEASGIGPAVQSVTTFGGPTAPPGRREAGG
jgi:hypothetical protein